MVKMRWMLMVVVLILLLTACSARYSESTFASTESPVPTEVQTMEAPETTAETTIAPETTEPKVTETSPTEATFAPLPETVSVADLVETVWDETLTWTDKQKYDNSFTGSVPELFPFSEDAVRVNGEIQDVLWEKINRELQNQEKKDSQKYLSAGYRAYLNGDVLSVMTWADDNHDRAEYDVWNLDLETGKQLTEQEMAARLGLSEEAYIQLITEAVTDAFYERCGNVENAPDPEFYQQQFDACISQENLAKVKLYFGEGGEVILIAPIIPIAGASSYPTLIPLNIP